VCLTSHTSHTEVGSISGEREVSMELSAAKQLALSLMKEHGFGDLPFSFHRMKNALGTCYFSGGVPTAIKLSEYWVPHLSEAEVRDTILHEIAHAMTPRDHHGAAWRAAARRIGANPSRTADTVPMEVQRKVKQLHAKYRATCYDCGNVHFFNRMTKTWRYRGYVCKNCRGQFNVQFNK